MIASCLLLVVFSQATARDARPPAPSATISGRITEREHGRPLARIVVALEAPPATRFEVLTDADGRYEFTDIPAGGYGLSAAPERHRSTYFPQRFGEAAPLFFGGGPARPNVEFKAGETRTGLDLALWRTLGIEGRVLDPTDQPMANVEVSVSRADDRFLPVKPSVTNDLGGYRL